VKRPSLAVALALSCAVLSGGLVACGDDDDEGGSGGGGGGSDAALDLVIGNSVPLTGDLADFDPPGDKAAQVAISEIEKAIGESDVGLTPNNDGNVIRLQIPDLTEERRKEMVKVVHGVGEEGKIAIRNVRRDVIQDLRELKKEGDAGEDDERRAEADLQKMTDECTGEIDSLLKGKEEEILEV